MSDELIPPRRLLNFLEEYLEVADLWQEYYEKAGNKMFGKGEERDEHLRIQTLYMLPLMERCKREGVPYRVLMDIIPGAFKTGSEKRWGILDTLYDDAGVERPDQTS